MGTAMRGLAVAAVPVVLGAAAALAGPGVPASAGQVAFQAQTTAAGVHLVVTQEPASSIVTQSLVDDAVGYAAGSYDSAGSSEALAAPVFPGRLVVQGPQLLCTQLFQCPTQPPAYPFLADASYPRRPHDTEQADGKPLGTGPAVVTPQQAAAWAGARGNRSTTQAAGTRLLAGTPGATSVGASSATSEVSLHGQVLVTHVTSTASDVAVGTLLHLDAVRTDVTIRLSPGHRPTVATSVRVVGATVVGQPVSVDQDGVHAAGHDVPSPQQQLSQQGISVRTVDASRTVSATGARTDGTGLRIDVQVPVSGVPYVPNPVPSLPPPFDQVPRPGVNANGTYVGHVTVAAAGAAAGLARTPAFSLGDFGPVPSGPPGSPGGAGAAPAPAGGAGGGTAGVPGGTASLPGDGSGTAAGAPAPPPVVAGPDVRGLRGFLDTFSLGTLYAALALGAVALFLLWRGTLLLQRRPVPVGAWWARLSSGGRRG